MQATETFQAGAEQFTVAIDIDLGTEQIITGDFSGSVPAGTVGRLRGAIRLLADLHVRGTLVADPTGVNLDGQNLYDIHTHDGGVLNLVGTEKTAWANWGDPVVGWQIGDSLVVAPTAVGVYTPTALTTTWQGSWAATTRPPNTADVLLVDGTIARPEVVNRSQSLVIRNVTRIMIHESGGVPNVHTLKWLKVLNSGKPGQLTFYPIHFHLLGDTARGSLVEGVVVDRGRNHAFVPHGSHGITIKDSVAYGTEGGAFWWDLPPAGNAADTVNDSNDNVWDHCLALWVLWSASDTLQYTGFALGAGVGDVCINSVAVAVGGTGTSQRSGFLWGENRSRRQWDFRNNLAHNCMDSGIFTWQNNDALHTIFDFTAYRCGGTGIDHGAYRNLYRYERISLTAAPLVVHAKSDYPRPGIPAMVFADVHSDTYFRVTEHGIPDMRISYLRNSIIPQVIYTESTHPSYWVYEDCDLVPVDFRLTGGSVGGLAVRIHPSSIIEVFESGVLTYRWAAGVWT